MSRSRYSGNNSTKKSTTKQIQPNQFNIFGGVADVTSLIDPEPQVIERQGIKVVGVVVPQSKIDIPGYIPEALRQARDLVPEVQTRGKPPWLSAKWQAERRKRKANGKS